jgi:hypothetical protein
MKDRSRKEDKELGGETVEREREKERKREREESVGPEG